LTHNLAKKFQGFRDTERLTTTNKQQLIIWVGTTDFTSKGSRHPDPASFQSRTEDVRRRQMTIYAPTADTYL
jgi:hypothetical protein